MTILTKNIIYLIYPHSKHLSIHTVFLQIFLLIKINNCDMEYNVELFSLSQYLYLNLASWDTMYTWLVNTANAYYLWWIDHLWSWVVCLAHSSYRTILSGVVTLLCRIELIAKGLDTKSIYNRAYVCLFVCLFVCPSILIIFSIF